MKFQGNTIKTSEKEEQERSVIDDKVKKEVEELKLRDKRFEYDIDRHLENVLKTRGFEERTVSLTSPANSPSKFSNSSLSSPGRFKMYTCNLSILDSFKNKLEMFKSQSSPKVLSPADSSSLKFKQQLDELSRKSDQSRRRFEQELADSKRNFERQLEESRKKNVF